MEEKFGLIQGIECRFVKTDPEIVEAISKRTGIDALKVKYMMRYNIFTVAQFAELSQLAISSILNKTRPTIIEKSTGKISGMISFFEWPA